MPRHVTQGDTLAQVIVTSPSIGDVLKYNGTNWINGTSSGSGQSWSVKKTPVESPNGSRTVFTLPGGDTYITGTLVVHLNGLYEQFASETTSSTFTFSDAPLASDSIMLIYRTS